MFSVITRSLPIILAGSLGYAISLHGDAFVFDIGGVLASSNKIRSFRELGIVNILQYFVTVRRGPNAIKGTFFETLNRVAKEHKISRRPGRTIAKDDSGKPVPLLMNLWLKGKITCKKLRTMIFESIDKHPEWFDYEIEKRLIRNLVDMVFTPEKFIKTIQLNKGIITFAKQCKQQGHQIYILSNWDAESFELLKQKDPAFFASFDGIIISGQTGQVKPSKKIFKTLLKKYHLKPRNCFFIDDQKENVATSRKLKICGILCKSNHSWLEKKPDLRYVLQEITRAQQAKNTVATAVRFV